MVDGYPRVVVTGGIGAGKSTVTDCLRRTGFVVVDADRIGHEVLAAGGPAVGQVRLLWPGVMRGGAVDRAALAAIVFSDPDELGRLEAVTHPLIRAEIARRVAMAADPVAVEVSVPRKMVGEGWTTIVVDAPDDVRRGRLRERGMGDDDVDARMASQPSGESWRSLGDHVIVNDGPLEDVCARVVELLRDLDG